MTRTRLAAFVLSLAILLGLGFRIHAIAFKKTITHDEGISYLAATGHQKAYKDLISHQQPPFGAWAPASDWKEFTGRERFFCFRTIGSDIALYDIHPPLYFWMLHVWIWIVNVHLWTGPLLNALITLLMIFTVYRFATTVMNDRLEASVIAFIWALSPYVLLESMEARPYGLLAWFSLVLVWRTIIYTENDGGLSIKELTILALVIAGGALTHYHFALAVAGCAVFAIIRLFRHQRQRLLMLSVSMATGYGLFFLLHPRFLQSFGQQREQAQSFAFDGFLVRFLETTTTFSQFYFHKRIGNPALLLVAALLVIATIVVLVKTRGPALIEIRGRARAVLFFSVWFSLCVASLYVLFISPKHAMGPKYLSMAWPFFAFVPVLVFRLFSPRIRMFMLVSLCLWQLGYASAYGLVRQFRDSKLPVPDNILRNSDVILVDTAARGFLPRIFWHLPDDQMIFAASQRYMLDNPDLWVDQLSSRSLYFSYLFYGNSKAQRDAIFAELEDSYQLDRLDEGVWFGADIFQLSD